MPGIRRGAPADDLAGRPDDHRLLDTFGRVATDLRVSLTDRCNLRCAYCMPAEGLDWMPDAPAAHRRRAGPADHRRGRAARRRRGPVHRRRAAAAPRPGRIVAATAALRTDAGGPRDRADHQRPGPGPARHPARGGGPGPGQRLAGHPGPGPVRADHPSRPPRRRAGRAARRRPGRPGPGQDQRGADARRQRRRGGRRCCDWACGTATSCGSSSRCRWTRSTPGTGTRWSPPRRSSPRCRQQFRLTPADPATRGAAPAETWWSTGRTAPRP